MKLETALYQAIKIYVFKKHYLGSCTDQNVALRASRVLLYSFQ